MPLSSSSEPALPAAWTDVLERIQHVLADALGAADERARALDAEIRARSVSEETASLAHASGPDGEAPALEFSDDCEKLASDMARILDTAQSALDRWLATAAQVGQKLAEQAARVV